MPEKPFRPCAYPCCGKLTKQKYCDVHTECAEKQRISLLDQKRSNSHARGYDYAWRRNRGYFLRENPVCQANACERPANEVDHIIPKRQGGTDSWDNLQALCKPCHSRKTATIDSTFARAAKAPP